MTIKAGYKQTEVGVIPEDWGVKPLVDLCKSKGLVRGPFGGTLKKENFVKSGYVVYEQRHAISAKLNVSRYYITEEKFNELKRFQVKANDLIVSCSGTIGRIYKIPIGAPQGVINQALLKITINNKILSDFFILLFKSPQIQSTVVDSSHGGAMPNLVGMEDFKLTIFQVPSKKEQKAIAQALSDVDALIEAQEKLIAKKQAIKTATMQQLLTGKKRLPPFDKTHTGYKQTELGKIPNDWETKHLGKLSKIQRGASPRPIDSPIWFSENSEVGWLRISDVSKANKYLLNTKQNLSSLGVENSRYVSENHLVMSICATVGRPIILRKNVCIHDGFVVFDNLKLDKDYLYYYLSDIESNWSKHGQTGSQMNLNTELINSTIVRLPSKTREQKAIAKVLSDMDKEIEALQAKLQKTKSIKQGMMQELLTGRTRLV